MCAQRLDQVAALEILDDGALGCSTLPTADKAYGPRGCAGGAVTAPAEHCSCTALLLVDDGLVLCDHGHVFALAGALPEDALEALAGDQG